jgi:flavin reductase (DIM6/NTAB) family NADH-FMN oxidoreductase RutF
MDPAAASTLFAWLNREVWLVTAQAGSVRGGLVATFVSQASSVAESPRVVVGLARHHHTWEVIEASGAFALHLLKEDNLDWVWRFGLESGRQRDKFEGLTVQQAQSGSPVLDGAIGWLDCRVEDRLDAGDRAIYLAEVLGSTVTHFAPPLTTARLQELAPPNLLGQLKRQHHNDSQLDAAAIRAWRQRKQANEVRKLEDHQAP